MQNFSISRTRTHNPASNLRLITASLAAALALPTHAQNTLEPVVVTASRVAEPLGVTLRDVSVVDGAALREAGVVDITDALRLLPGVELSVNGPGAVPNLAVKASAHFW